MRLKLLIYTVIVLAEIACGYAGFWQGVYLLKPLIMLSLLFWTFGYRTSHSLLWIGMWFGLGGDVFLMIRGKDLFIAGLSSFLVMQIFYISAFLQTITRLKKTQFNPVRWWYIVPFILYAAAFLAVLHPTLTQNPATAGLWIPVVAYAVCLCSMGAAAALRKGSVSRMSYRWVIMGAVLFIISDSSIAGNKFLQPFEASSLIIMTTYAAAQWLIVWGMLKE
ncbi:lysoplasmalogenase [Runella slithyformis]|uniref:YhhN family protein n=1 Tax=Runella slithyformis (strain ATCC 29530 / DSM 19594 / LMG 11500 / NCIMB 11436 / LSU 4) TaxID=761193 RepID=A0A7U4E8I3_RUNSL|nr:lysoplasmalogenase [Runella slithyformis]AEI51731.1 YhhN family protein [Runella slithyformis DSM 19594]